MFFFKDGIIPITGLTQKSRMLTLFTPGHCPIFFGPFSGNQLPKAGSNPKESNPVYGQHCPVRPLRNLPIPYVSPCLFPGFLQWPPIFDLPERLFGRCDRKPIG